MEKVINFLKNNFFYIILLGFIFILAYYLRMLYLPDNMLFGFEQGRDALMTKDILSLKKLTMIGPKTDIDGIFHGAWYYYLLSFIYLISHGDPGIVISIFALMGAAVCVVIYFISLELTKDKRYSLFASFFSAISYLLIIYSRWLSNVSPSILTVSLFFLFFIKLIKSKKNQYWIPTLFFCAFLFHFEILNGIYGLFIITISIFIFHISVKNKSFAIGILMFLIVNSPFIIFDLRHQFILTNNIIHYISSQSLSNRPLSIITNYSDGLIEELTTTIFPKNSTFIFFFFLSLLYFYITKVKKTVEMKVNEKIILILFFWSFPYIFLLKYSPMLQFYAGTSIIIIVSFVYLLQHTFHKYHPFIIYLFLLLLIIGNISFTTKNLYERNNIFYHTVQKNYFYADQLRVFDFMFNNGKLFQFDAFNIPYYHKEAWDYLYEWYGNKKYTSIINLNKKIPDQEKKYIYLIIEPSTAGLWLDKWIQEYNKTTTLLETKKIGSIQLQVRIKK